MAKKYELNTDTNLPLHSAIIENNLDNIKQLVSSNTNIETCDINLVSPLFLAANYGHTHIVKFLINLNANINVKNNKGLTPLHTASEQGHVEVVKKLFVSGADLNGVTLGGGSAINLALLFNHLEVIEYLCSNGADIEFPYQHKNFTPLYLAIYKKNMSALQLFAYYGAKDCYGLDESKAKWEPLSAGLAEARVARNVSIKWIQEIKLVIALNTDLPEQGLHKLIADYAYPSYADALLIGEFYEQ